MSSLDVAANATTSTVNRTHNGVVSRTVVRENFSIRLTVPNNANRGTYPCGDTHVAFMHYAQFIAGGAVHFYVHGDDPAQYVGSTIIAHVRVMKKEYDSGKEMLYIDLFPSRIQDPVATHRLAVMPKSSGWRLVPDVEVIELPAPLRGVIVLAQPDAKIVVPPQTDDDFQLDRLLADGWKITQRYADQVNLAKPGKKEGEVRTMTHRLKQSKKKN